MADEFKKTSKSIGHNHYLTIIVAFAAEIRTVNRVSPRNFHLRGRGIPAQGRFGSIVKDRSPEGLGSRPLRGFATLGEANTPSGASAETCRKIEHSVSQCGNMSPQ